MHLDVLCVSMEHGVLGQLRIVDVVTLDQDGSQHFDSEVL